jgi:hypothetical protein
MLLIVVGVYVLDHSREGFEAVLLLQIHRFFELSRVRSAAVLD